MNNYKITMTYGVFFVMADYYSIVGDKYQFWKGKTIIVSYPANEVRSVEIEPLEILPPQ